MAPLSPREEGRGEGVVDRPWLFSEKVADAGKTNVLPSSVVPSLDGEGESKDRSRLQVVETEHELE